MNDSPQDRDYADIPVRPAATILLIRDSDDGLEVFMVVRHHEIDFASGALVFPGGSLEPDDHVIAAESALCTREGDTGPLALRVAAVRETFEECGVLLAREQGEDALISGARSAELTAKAKGRSFADLIRAEKLTLALDTLIPFAHWVTPPIMPKRFDTHFFLAAAPVLQLAVHDGAESVDSLWINPKRALEQAEQGKYTIIFPTRLNLQMLARQDDVSAAIEAATNRKIVTVEPVPVKTATGRALKIPLEAGYDGEVFPM